MPELFLWYNVYMKRTIFAILIMCLVIAGCGKNPEPETVEETETSVAVPEIPQREFRDAVSEMISAYASDGKDADYKINALLDELMSMDEDAGARWEMIMELWHFPELGRPLNYDVLPDGLPDSDALCIVVLGFQLNPNGTMKGELVERLKVALNSAQKYPNAYIVCTGGGTAFSNASVTEAGEMAKWLEEQGIEKSRIIVEDRSLTTAQNAIFTYEILTSEYPMVRSIAIVSSDYHIATGELLFTAEAILRSDSILNDRPVVISNAAWDAPTGELSKSFQARGLQELSDYAYRQG
jgi:hypothetical protein